MRFFSSKQHKQHFFLELSGMFNCVAYNVTETSQHILVVVSYLGHGSHTHGRLDHEPILVSLLSRFDLEQKNKTKKGGKMMIFFNFVSRYLKSQASVRAINHSGFKTGRGTYTISRILFDLFLSRRY